MLFRKISLIWYQFKQEARGCQLIWTPCVLYVWKISIFSLHYGLELLIISWSCVTMCAFHVGNGIFHGDFVISFLWIFFKSSTWCFIIFTDMFPGYYVTFHARLRLKLSWLKDYISFQSISVLLILKLWVKIFQYISWWGVMVVYCNFLNIISKCQISVLCCLYCN